MAKKKHNKDKKLHNFDEKLHNSNELDLTWQEEVDLQPEDEVEGGSEIYYFTDEDGNIHSREFLAEELIPDESEVEGSPPLIQVPSYLSNLVGAGGQREKNDEATRSF